MTEVFLVLSSLEFVKMPFHQRIVEPRHLSRLPRRDAKTLGEEDGAFIVVDGRKLRKPVLFTALDEVCSHTLINILHQLSDLSRNASDIFLGIEMEAGMVFQRSCRIQVRLETLHNAVIKFDHKKIKIRKCDCDVFLVVVYLTLHIFVVEAVFLGLPSQS